MNSSAPFLNPSDAANRLGVSTKALRIYEQRGLISPTRTDAGWRTYSPAEMARGGEIVALRNLGLSLGQIAKVMDGDTQALGLALAEHQATLDGRVHRMLEAVAKTRQLRESLANGQMPSVKDLTDLLKQNAQPRVAFDLPWPWGGERFELHDIRPLNFITGPLGSGKTRLAMRIAEVLPDATFLGLERLTDDGSDSRAKSKADPALKARIDEMLGWLVDEGATASGALIALLTGLAAANPAILVVDIVEQGLDKATQCAVIAYVRRRGPDARPLFILTRSNAILDMDHVDDGEAVIYCPANHSPPLRVAPIRGSAGYEAVALCLASPDVRARTEGVIAVRPKAA